MVLPDPLSPTIPKVSPRRTVRVASFTAITSGLLRKTVGYVKAVNDATLTVRRGETVGIVGESGSGKTTLAMAILRLMPSTGKIVVLGQDIQGWRSAQMRAVRRNMQVVFQDPYGSLSPRIDRKSTRLNSSHVSQSRMPSSA